MSLQVQALKFGHVLVIDEADKAPINVTCILKTLVESGEMILGDGRRVLPGIKSTQCPAYEYEDSQYIYICKFTATSGSP